jgi:hypothetical protein
MPNPEFAWRLGNATFAQPLRKYLINPRMSSGLGLKICKTLKQISKEEEKMLMSKLKNCPDACCRKGRWQME